MVSPTQQSRFARSVTAGFAAGLRSQTPVAALAAFGTPDGVLAKPWVKRVALASAVGEMIVDKLPIAPSRVRSGPLLGRAAFGALAGALTARAAGASPATGAAAGAVAAVVGTYVGYLGRTRGADLAGVPDLPLALLEDAFAWSLALAAAKG